MGSRRSGRPRREVSNVRFQAKRLASGLYRHRAVKFIIKVDSPPT